MKIHLMVLAAVASLAACSPAKDDNPALRLVPPAAAAPSDPKLAVRANAVDDHRVKLTITTNIPTPVEAMAGVNLKGQKNDDTYIGYTDRVTLTGPVTSLVLDTSKASKPLPAADYDVEVNFYRRWGAEKNAAAKGVPDLTATTRLKLAGDGTSRASTERRNKLQGWVMENVAMNVPWNEKEYVRRLGGYEKSPATLSHLHDAYYFPDADMTLIVNRVRGEITIWRMGRTTE